MTTSLTDLTTGQLNRIIAIKVRIEKLQGQIDSITANGEIAASFTVEAPTQRRRSAAVRAKMAAAARARWAKIKGKADSKPAKKKDRRSSAATRAKLAAAARRRWAKVKAAGKKAL